MVGAMDVFWYMVYLMVWKLMVGFDLAVPVFP